MKLFGNKKAKPLKTIDTEPYEEPRLLSYRVANLQGIGDRAQQEDSFSFANSTDVTKILNQGLFAVVADGMGGMSGGQLASQTAVSVLRENFNQMNVEANIPEQLCRGMLSACSSVFEQLGSQGGSTAITCVFYNECLYYASVGDSFLFLKRGDELYQLNTEHNVYNRQLLEDAQSVDLTRWNKDEIDESHAVTSFIGMNGLEAVDYLKRPLPLEDGDIIMLCSDGVCTLSEEDISKCLSESTPIKMCEKLEEGIIAANKKYQDNYTALIIKCEY